MRSSVPLSLSLSLSLSRSFGTPLAGAQPSLPRCRRVEGPSENPIEMPNQQRVRSSERGTHTSASMCLYRCDGGVCSRFSVHVIFECSHSRSRMNRDRVADSAVADNAIVASCDFQRSVTAEKRIMTRLNSHVDLCSSVTSYRFSNSKANYSKVSLFVNFLLQLSGHVN